MTVASEITKLQSNLADCYTAVFDKGGTMPEHENFDNLATAISSINAVPAPTGKYQLLDRITDDSNNEIGTVSGFFTDENDVEYAVVCLTQNVSSSNLALSSSTGNITNLPNYSSLRTSNVWNAVGTATSNTQNILDWCSANNFTSDACNHCRNQSFVIGGVTYYGQVPNFQELVDIQKNYPNLGFSSDLSLWASTQYSTNEAWSSATGGGVSHAFKTSNTYIKTCPVLELPNAL